MTDPGVQRALAEAAVRDPDARARLLAAWRLPPVALDGLLGELEVPDSAEMGRLVAWAGSEEPAGPDEDAAGRDLRVLARAAELPTDPRRRASAALLLLARLGEEFDARERVAPARRPWAASGQDADAREAWRALFGGALVEAGRRFAGLWGDTVRGSFAGVASVLRLPGRVADKVGADAHEQLDLAVAGAHLDMAARLVETSGEPVAALASALGPRAARRVDLCAARRSAWAGVVDVLRAAGMAPTLAEGADAIVLHRLIENLRAGRASPHPMGLPAWGVVTANRQRLRGRLRAAATLDPARLADVVLGLDALHARTTVTVARFAWDWAWREARTGFGFDPGRLRPPACVVTEDTAPRFVPLDASEVAAVRTFLLLVAGRGAWLDLHRWIDGDPGRELGRSLYRCLDAVPDRLADPAPVARSDRARRYERLRDHLADGGIDDYLPDLLAAARAVSRLRDGRALRAQLDSALAPWWDARSVTPPRHHLPGFRDALVALLTLQGAVATKTTGEARPASATWASGKVGSQKST